MSLLEILTNQKICLFLSIENKILMESFKNNFFGILALKQIAQESLFSFLLRIKTSPNNQAIVAINIYHCVWCARGDSSKLEIKSFRANLVNILKALYLGPRLYLYNLMLPSTRLPLNERLSVLL